MAVCPQCGRKLHLYDWRPECPGCGVNLNYYDANERLLDEAEKAEKEHARFQPRVDRAKAAFAGSGWAIARIPLTLLPAGALFLPLLQTAGGNKSLNVVGVFERLSAAGFGAALGKAFGDPLCLSAVLLLLSAAMILVNLVLITMSLGKHGKVRVILTHGFQLLCASGAVICALIGGANGAPELFTDPSPASPGIGAYLYLALLLLLFGYHLFLLWKGIPVHYTPCLIGGIPSGDYFRYVEEGVGRSELRRRMLLALSDLREAQERALEKEGGGRP